MNLEGVLIEDRKKDTLLYAGIVQVRITDWFFFKEKASLEYIGLQDAVVHMNRTDSVWNYAFLQDYFASPNTKTQKKAGIEFDLKTVLLKNVSFVQKDGWVGNDKYIRVGSLQLSANNLSITQKVIDINSLKLSEPFFHQASYTGNRPPSTVKVTSATGNTVIVTDTALQWNPQNWTIAIKSLSIEDGRYKNDNGTGAPLSFFDGKHLDFSKLNGRINNLRLVRDTLRAAVALSAKERSGFTVQSLQSNLRFHPQLMEFNQLYLKTNRSLLRNYFAMKFDRIGDMNDFIHAVTMTADFEASTVSSDDLAFFAPGIKDLNKTFAIEGKVQGTVDDFTADNVQINAGKGTVLRGNFAVIGLPNIATTYLNIDARELRTSYADAVQFVPSLRNVSTPNLRKLGAVSFTGSFTGFLTDFVTYGTINTALGTLKTDLNMKLPKNGSPVYSGSLATAGFELGQLLNDNQLGNVAFSGDVKGRGFSLNTLDATIDAKVKRLQYGNYTYQNIAARGRIKNKTFNGDFDINDPNADLHLTGLINFGGTEPQFDVSADIVTANLKALQLLKEDVRLSGRLNFNFKGKNISDFLGNAQLNNISFKQGDKIINIDSLVVSSDYVNGVRSVRAKSTQFDATITGQFDLKSLPDAFTLFLSRYYPSYIKPPARTFPAQNFTFDITTGVVEDYVGLIDSRLSGFNNSHLTGLLNVSANSLLLNADVPSFSFDRYQFSDVGLNAVGNLDSLSLSGQVNNAVISDSILFPQTTFTLVARNDVSDITINTTANQAINQAALSAQIKTFSDGASVQFNPSSFVLNGKVWSIEQGGELDFRKNAIVQGSLVLKETTQQIRISSQPSDIGNWNDLHVSLHDVNVGDITPFLIKNIRIEGLLSGDVIVEDPQNRFNVTAKLKTDALRVDSHSIGQVLATLNYNNSTGRLTGSGNNVDLDHLLNFDLDLDLKDTANLHRDRISISPQKYPVKILERFIGNLFSDLQGYLTGKLDILEGEKGFDYVGKARLTDAGLKVNFSQVFYKIDDADIVLTENEINLGKLKLRDKDGATATLQGSILHKGFQNMEFFISARVDNRPMQLINTTYNDNQQFYGTAKGNGIFELTGPQYDMRMNIEATPSTTDSSYITLPPSRTRESGQASFMVERKYGREMTEEELRGTATNLTYDISLTANPLVNVEVILDEATGDVIKGRGVGNLRLRAGTSEPLSIRGRFDLQNGYYVYTFQSFFKKPFVLLKGSNNFIEWTGDPYTAQVNFDAVYTAENVSFAPLASSLQLSNFTTYRGDVYVVAQFSGELFHPNFTFKLQFPENSAARNDPSLAFGIQQIEKNTNEINKQVTYLIVTNSFAPYESSVSGYNPLNEFAYSTISGLFFGEINKRLNQLLSKVLQNNELTFNFTGSLYNRNLIEQGFDINQGNFNLSFGKSFLNERIQLNFGGTFDVPLESDLEQSLRILPDVSASFLINKSGSFRITLFYTQNNDLVISQVQNGRRGQSAGAKLSYRKEFNSLSEFLFGRIKGKRKPALLPVKDSVEVSVPDGSQ